ncbi:response regulator [uncultured Sphingomonas sp.]|uniref:response regulator n=1 Tax=uncultured Sphingomonas sp. TaxID=158754 RepID=UPI0025D4BBA4|nr:response regulator [uncultured Sphingomonas sp.]
MAGNLLTGKRILIVEDEYFIATDLKGVLADAGAVPVGPVADLEAGLAIASEGNLDGALLDVNLEGDHSFPIADLLTQRGVPYMFLTGYDDWALPDAYRGVPHATKPLGTTDLLDGLVRLLTGETQT